jgi:AraC-like DNA-binding protein
VIYDTGYNSKSAFCTAFKKYTGLTPTEFKKKGRSVVNAEV